jgi:hypothetical protein
MKTIIPGPVITSLDQLYRCEFIIVRDKPMHKGWFMSWPLRLAVLYIESRSGIYEGIKAPKETKEEA